VLYGDALLGLATLGLWIFCLLDGINTVASSCRNLEKTWWIMIVFFFPLVGSIIWLVAGRPQHQRVDLPYKGNRGTRAGAKTAPDDDRSFLEDLTRQNREDRELLHRWEDDLKRREEALRPPQPGTDPTPD
jgi:hypothetical protein